MTRYLNVKHGIEILHSDGTTQILAGFYDPSGAGLTAEVGSVFLCSISGGGLFIKTGISDTDWKPITTSSGISSVQHIALHNDDTYTEFSRFQGRINTIDEWVDSSKTHYISSTALYRAGGKTSSFKKELYDYETGTVVIATVSGVITRSGGKVVSVEYTRDNLIGGF